MTECKALSVRQPWASLIASGEKTIELRTWTVKYRGPLVICSGMRYRKGQRRDDILAPEAAIDAGYRAPLGCAIALVNLVDIRPATASDARAACCAPSERDFAWVLEGAVPIPDGPPVLGRLSLFSLDCAALAPGFRVLVERANTRSASR